MQLKNEEDVANGDVGEVLNIYKADGKSRMRVDFGDGKIMEYTEGDIWPLNLAYCITVHKAQGSEYPVVILPMLTCFLSDAAEKSFSIPQSQEQGVG